MVLYAQVAKWDDPGSYWSYQRLSVHSGFAYRLPRTLNFRTTRCSRLLVPTTTTVDENEVVDSCGARGASWCTMMICTGAEWSPYILWVEKHMPDDPHARQSS